MADQVTNVFCTSHFTSNKFELLYAEQLVPSEGDRSNISWSSCNYYFGKRQGYAGIQHQQNTWNEGVQFEYNNICSIWDLEDQSSKSNLQPEVELTHKIQGVYSTAFKNQGGSGLHTSHPMPWSPNQWYATVIRRWYIPGESKTRAAMFMYSYAEKKWTKYVSFAIPGADLPLTGNDCVAFLQRFSGNELGYRGVYGQHFRMLKDGSWEKPQHYVASASAGDTKSWKAELYQGVNIELTAGGKFDNQKNEHTFHPNQFDKKPKPAMLTPMVTKVKAHYVKEQQAVRVEWEIAEDRPPQLSHSIKVYKDGLFVSNPPVATNADDASGKRIISLFQAPSNLKPGTYSTNIEIQVEWEITEDQPPKLSHRIKVQKDGVFVSDPVATNSDSVPEKRSTFFQTPRSLEPGTYWTSIEITDIFNQKSNLGYTSFVVN